MAKLPRSTSVEAARLQPGDRVRFTTEIGITYDVEAEAIVDGHPARVVHRRSLEIPGLSVAPATTEKASVSSKSPMGHVVVGESVTIVGTDQLTQKPELIRTTPVASIEVQSPAAEAA